MMITSVEYMHCIPCSYVQQLKKYLTERVRKQHSVPITGISLYYMCKCLFELLHKFTLILSIVISIKLIVYCIQLLQNVCVLCMYRSQSFHSCYFGKLMCQEVELLVDTSSWWMVTSCSQRGNCWWILPPDRQYTGTVVSLYM